jgi:hypothetical protein
LKENLKGQHKGGRGTGCSRVFVLFSWVGGIKNQNAITIQGSSLSRKNNTDFDDKVSNKDCVLANNCCDFGTFYKEKFCQIWY